MTATVVGTAYPVDEVQVWKDVDGIMTADPRLGTTTFTTNNNNSNINY